MAIPSTMTASSACRMTCLVCSWSLAPIEWATCTEYPTPMALRMLLISQVGEELMATAAVAFAPKAPTMAVST